MMEIRTFVHVVMSLRKYLLISCLCDTYVWYWDRTWPTYPLLAVKAAMFLAGINASHHESMEVWKYACHCTPLNLTLLGNPVAVVVYIHMYLYRYNWWIKELFLTGFVILFFSMSLFSSFVWYHSIWAIVQVVSFYIVLFPWLLHA